MAQGKGAGFYMLRQNSPHKGTPWSLGPQVPWPPLGNSQASVKSSVDRGRAGLRPSLNPAGPSLAWVGSQVPVLTLCFPLHTRTHARPFACMALLSHLPKFYPPFKAQLRPPGPWEDFSGFLSWVSLPPWKNLELCVLFFLHLLLEEEKSVFHTTQRPLGRKGLSNSLGTWRPSSVSPSHG